MIVQAIWLQNCSGQACAAGVLKDPPLVPESTSCRHPVNRHFRPVHFNDRTWRHGSKNQEPSLVFLRYLVPHAHMLTISTPTLSLFTNETREAWFHKYERLGFSSPPGVLRSYAALAIWWLASARVFPSVAIALSATESRGRPKGRASDRS